MNDGKITEYKAKYLTTQYLVRLEEIFLHISIFLLILTILFFVGMALNAVIYYISIIIRGLLITITLGLIFILAPDFLKKLNIGEDSIKKLWLL